VNESSESVYSNHTGRDLDFLSAVVGNTTNQFDLFANPISKVVDAMSFRRIEKETSIQSEEIFIYNLRNV